MKTENFEVFSEQDGLKLSCLKAEPDGEAPIGVVQLVHGMSEHKERYLPFMAYLADHGYASIIHDHRGHGASVSGPEDLGYFGADGARKAVADVYQLTQKAHSLFPALPVHLFGHSMGSLIVRCYLQQHDDAIASLTISGCVGSNPLAGAALAAVKVMAAVRRDRYRSRGITRLAFGAFNKPFQPAASVNSWICSDRKVVEEYDRDPLCGFTFTLNGYEALFRLLLQCYSKSGWQMKQPQLSILMVSGEEDPCMNGLNGLLDAADRLRRQGYQRVAVSAVPGMRHEVLNEVGKESVWQQILAHMTAV